MKNARVIALGLLFLAAGLTGARAQGAGPYFYNVDAMDYPLHERFFNGPRFAYTANLPAVTGLDWESLSGGVFTDGSGRIAGLVYARIYFGGPNNHVTDYGAFSVTVTGTTGDRGTNPLVKITMNGKGYDFDGISNHPNASLNLKFVSTNQYIDVPPIPVTINSTNYNVIYANGTTNSFSDGPATRTNSAFTFLSGTIRGNIKPGNKSKINNGNDIKVTENGRLVTAGTNWVVINGTNFVEQKLSGGLILNVLSNIDAQVLQPIQGSKLHLNANIGSTMDLYAGNGTANYGSSKYSATFAGVAFARGSRMQVNGTLGPVIVAYDPIPGTTNFLPRIVQNAIRQMTITSGKIFGQKVPKMEGVNVPAPHP